MDWRSPRYGCDPSHEGFSLPCQVHHARYTLGHAVCGWQQRPPGCDGGGAASAFSVRVLWSAVRRWKEQPPRPPRLLKPSRVFACRPTPYDPASPSDTSARQTLIVGRLLPLIFIFDTRLHVRGDSPSWSSLFCSTVCLPSHRVLSLHFFLGVRSYRPTFPAIQS